MADLTIDGTPLNPNQTLDGTHTYDYVNITNGGTLYVTPYNGSGTTGTLILNVTEINVDSTSSIIGTARGYRGGAGGSQSGSPSFTFYGGHGGEVVGYGGGSNGADDHSGNGYGGGGGGGGSYGSVGGSGGSGAYAPGGAGGVTNGTLSGMDINMGSGAGGGGYGASTNGNAGGGMLTINGQNINIHGTVNFNGGTGGSGGSSQGGGGGGGASGGGILLNASNINISNAIITSNGGAGGGGRHSGGTGGGGRIKIFPNNTYNASGATISAGTGTAYVQLPPQTCPITPKYSGDTITLQTTPRDGIGPYYVELNKDGSLIDPVRLGGTNPGTSQIYNAPENVSITRTYLLTDEDIRNALTGTIIFSVFISDSCPIAPMTCTESCTVDIGCYAPVCNFTVA